MDGVTYGPFYTTSTDIISYGQGGYNEVSALGEPDHIQGPRCQQHALRLETRRATRRLRSLTGGVLPVLRDYPESFSIPLFLARLSRSS